MEDRAWELLNNMSDKLSDIETDLKEIVRIQVQIKGHGEALKRFGKRLDDHSNRVRQLEIERDKASAKVSVITSVWKWGIGIASALVLSYTSWRFKN